MTAQAPPGGPHGPDVPSSGAGEPPASKARPKAGRAPNGPPASPTVLPCGCPCGCARPSGAPWVESAVLARRARCEACARPAHRSAHPAAPAGEPARPVTVVARPDPRDAALDARIAAQQQREILAAAWERWQAGLPEKFRGASTDHPKIRERLARWKAGQPGTAGIAILGTHGEGKTWMAVAYANAAIRAGLVRPGDVLYGTEAELLSSAANAAFGDVDRNLRRLIDPRYRMIVIDDVGRGTWLRDDMRPKVFSLVLDAAWRDNRVVVVTTNLVPGDLAEYIGAGAMDRLRSIVGYDAIDLSDRDMRRKVTEEALARAGTPAR